MQIKKRLERILPTNAKKGDTGEDVCDYLYGTRRPQKPKLEKSTSGAPGKKSVVTGSGNPDPSRNRREQMEKKKNYPH